MAQPVSDHSTRRGTLLARLSELFDQDPRAAEACVKVGEYEPVIVANIADDLPCPALPTDRYVEDSHTRWQLFEAFLERCAFFSFSASDFINASALAIFLVAPLPVLERRVRAIHDITTASQLFNELASHSMHGIRTFLAKGGTGSKRLSSGSATPMASLVRQTDTPPTAPSVTAATTDTVAGPSTPQQRSKRKASESPADSPANKSMRTTHTRTTSNSSLLAVASTPRPSTPVASTPPSVAGGRSRAATRSAKAREGGRCFLSGLSDPEAAHIFPFSAASNRDSWLSLDLLCGFWGEEKLATWRALCDDRDVTESPQNLLCMNEQMHSWWGAARFGLKPITATEKSVVVQFHWFKKPGCQPRTQIDIHAGEGHVLRRLCSGDVHEWDSAEPMLAHRETGLPLRTGQLFTIRADDPTELPSMELLELQWNLLRVAALSGAAGLVDAEGSTSDADPDVDAFIDKLSWNDSVSDDAALPPVEPERDENNGDAFL